MLIKFTKMHGLGNDFMVIDGVRQHIELTPELTARLGDRNFGVGFDQLLLVEKPKDAQHDFHYRIFNRDGSEVQMCGNGARCFARFVHEKGLCDKNEIHVTTVSGELVLTIEDDGEVVVNMGVPCFTPSKIPCTFAQEAPSYELPLACQLHEHDPEALQQWVAIHPTLTIGAVSMGNPHMTTVVDDVAHFPVELLGPLLEKHSYFPEKVNVGFMQVVSRSEVKLRVFERGCGETMACGTGSSAAVVVGMTQGLLDSKVKVHLPGGTLSISWQGQGKPVLMKGPATHVYEGIISI